ncbi:6-bladed beta-propeller [Thiovibrio sp. JS02]
MYFFLSGPHAKAFADNRKDTRPTTAHRRGAVSLVSLTLMVLLFALPPSGRAEKPASAKELIGVVTILNEDAQGEPLRFPSAVACSRDDDELYVVNGGKGGIVIYDNDFFPYLFLGPGRGIDAPQHIFFDRETGRIFICQGATSKHPPKLSILNAAFFPVAEILFTDIPGGEKFSPARGALGKNGNIYLVGANTRGVLVLDKNGGFLRWLSPVDKLHPRQSQEEITEEEEKSPEEAAPSAPGAAEATDAQSPDDTAAEKSTDAATDAALLGLPTELLPKSRSKKIPVASDTMLEPVLLNDIAIGRDGHLFLLSEETSRVYVYSASETPLFSFGQKGGSSGKMSRPRGIAIDENKKCIYVVDYMRHTVLVFDLGGKYVFEFGGRGSGPMWFNFPNAIAVDRKGNLAIADLFNNRVQILKADFDMTFPIFQNVKTVQPGQESETPAAESEEATP